MTRSRAETAGSGSAASNWTCALLNLRAYTRAMPHRNNCGKCGRPVVVTFSVTPESAWTTVALNRWKTLCASCFDIEAHKAKVRYSFAALEAVSWSDRPEPRNARARK